MQLHIGTQLRMDPHVLFKLGKHTCDSSDKRLVITLSVRVFQKQTLFMWVHFLVAMTTEHSPFPPQQTSYTLLHHHGTPTELCRERYAYQQVYLSLTQTHRSLQAKMFDFIK